mmetsp:Transcript_24179/g.34618  ORF Transcript_24179/g.34618 Transcript_24179/m.34618 type:complete len:82 (-) Transcript_24179:82-327(-)
MEKLEEMIQDRKRKLKEHESGHRRLNNDEHELVSRQARNFQRKLTQMKKMDPEDHADMLQHEAASLYQLNSVDYLDFDATK